MSQLKGVCIGAGYFSQFHYEAWQRLPEVNIVAVCDLDENKAKLVAEKYHIKQFYTDFEQMLEEEQPDFVDIITPPATHKVLCAAAAKRGVNIICQKALAPTLQEAHQIVANAEANSVRIIVHENFRFQPWHREIKQLLDDGVIGDTLYTLNFRMRMGDGWQHDAYLERQPYFREMPRLLIYETGIHFIDTFRYLAGEVQEVYARLRKLNKAIAGEDCGFVHFTFQDGIQAYYDASRYHETNDPTPRYTFGEFLLEGNAGSIRLSPNGRLTIQPLGKPEREHEYHHQNHGFAGDCVFEAQRHFARCLADGKPAETEGSAYLQNIVVQEAIYESNEVNKPVSVL